MGDTGDGTARLNAVVVVAIAAYGAVFGVGCEKTTKDHNAVAEGQRRAAPAIVNAPPTAPTTSDDGLLNLRREVMDLRGRMRDTVDEEDVNARTLAGRWARAGYPFSDMLLLPETSFAKANNDIAAERGKMLCVKGMLVDIEADKHGTQIHTGYLFERPGERVTFFAVGSTHSLLAGNDATFCGVMTGKHLYKNAVGALSQSFRMVGMFDLPENRGLPKSSAGQ